MEKLLKLKGRLEDSIKELSGSENTHVLFIECEAKRLLKRVEDRIKILKDAGMLSAPKDSDGPAPPPPIPPKPSPAPKPKNNR